MQKEIIKDLDQIKKDTILLPSLFKQLVEENKVLDKDRMDALNTST